ncbi:MAG: hypothetical protein K2N61_02715 [Lachnospiraceae bacterium]|nr:hypothetical protein [Lachnospiraceae bacterium]
MRTAIYNAKEHLKSFFYTKFLLLSKKFREGISGLGVVEVILILLVVVGLVLIFKSQITTIINTLFKSIKTQIKSV